MADDIYFAQQWPGSMERNSSYETRNTTGEGMVAS